MEIETPRLLLRPISMEDSPAIQKYFDNWNIIKYIGAEVPWPYPSDGATSHLTEMLKKVESSETYFWGIVIKDMVPEVVGVVEYRLSDNEDDNRGFWLAEPFWGYGYMTEAVVATQDYVFHELQTNRLIVRNAESNEGSRIIKKRCGAEQIDRIPGEYLSGDKWEEVWEITAERWNSVREDKSLNRFRM